MAEAFIVRGFIMDARQRPVAGVVVRAFDKDLPSLKSDQPLGDATTDANGSYTITFGEEQFRARESGRADVYIEVRGVGDELFGRSLTRPNPGREERIDLTIEHRPERHASEYEGLVALLAPLIEPMPLADVTAEDVAFLSKDTGAELPRTAWLAAAAWLGRHSGVRSEAFYGWARRDPAVPVEWMRVPHETEPPARRELLLAILERLVTTPPDELVRALHASIEERIIPGEIRDEVDEIVRALVRSSLVAHQVVARLRDAETDLPIAGRVVRVVDLESSRDADEIGRDTTSDDGLFVVEFGVSRGQGRPTRRLRLSVNDATDREVWSTDVQVTTASSEVLEVRMPSLRLAEPEAHALEQVVAAIRLDVPALLPLLARRNIRTLGDIRRAGGLGRIDGLPTEIDPSALHALGAHADLARVSSDVAVNATLIGKGFAAVGEIARTPLPTFVDAVHETIGDFAAAKMHVAARAQTTFLGNVVTGLALEQANGYATLMDATADTPAADDVLSERCGCKDCEAAVSPAAYLVDLLGYANTHLKEDGKAVAVDYLEKTFYQPFGELPTDCDAVDERVRQARLCIEVLRAYGKVHPPAAEQTATLAGATRAYLVAAYAMLLAKFGTSYEEVRLARTAPSEVRRALADRLGITLTEPRPDPLTTTGDELDQLFLDAAAPEVEPRALTERALERLFGLADTTRDALSDGVKMGDATSPPELARWRFSGVAWGRNTDSDGLVHLTVKSFVTSTLESHVEVYQDGARTKLVAAGQAKALSGKRVVKLVTKGASGLSGSATVDALSAANTNVSVALVPKLLAWRLGNLRTTWRRQDFPLDVFATDHEPQAEQRPVIDPDVIGPDDFRRPEVAEPVFALWKTRRLWVDQRIDDLAALTTIVVAGAETFTVPDVDKVLASMYSPLAYGATSISPWLAVTPVASFEALLETLQGGTSADVRAVHARIARDLNLTSEAFVQLVFTVTKHRQWLRDPKGERVPADEWDDLFSVLVRVQKARLFSAWIVEEGALPVRFGPQDFWGSEREPREGAWPPPRTAGRPLIDPDEAKLTDLPEPSIGKTAIQLWHARRAALVAEIAAIKTERETNGFDAMLRRTLGHPASGDPLQHDLSAIESDLISSDAATVAVAIEKVVRDLHLTVEAFHRLMAMKEQAAPASPRPPRAAEWVDLHATLLGAHKRKHLYPLWSAEENAAGLTVEYWRACKAQLPRARVLPEERATWRDGLALRSRPALIDPDRIDIAELDVLAGAPAFAIWEARRDWIKDAIANMDAEPKTLAGFDSIVSAKLSVAVEDLVAVDERRKAGEAIQARLDQLHLTNAAFVRLLEIRALLAAGQPVLPEEWAGVHSILVQVAKLRLSAVWREEERLSGITLSPDFFVPPPPLPAKPIEAAAAWRFDQEERFEWLDKLTARVEQERSTLGGVHEVVSDVEASALPSLRDALVSAVGAGTDLSTKATWVAERLLIDAKTDGCQKTTRIAQAIETVQGLLFAARTSQSSALQTLRLSLDAPDFDEEWRWIGSYATWRAAMFVYMYPENIAVGSLRRRQTPAFQALVKSLRQTRRLTSEQACAFAHEYATYYEDIARLVIGGTVQALVTRRSGTRCVPGAVVKKPLVLMVGRGGVSSRLYWSTFDPADTSGHAQSFWDYVPGVAVVANVVGVALYERSSTERRAFVFIRTMDDKLSFLTFDLESGRWDGPVELALPPGDPRSLDIAVDQNTFFYHPPRVALRAGGDIYFRSLNPEGSGWQDGDWSWFRLNPKDLNLAGIDRLFAVTEGRLWVRKGSYITVRDVWVQPGSYIVFEQLPPGAGDHGAEYLGAVYWGKEKTAWYRWLVQQRTDGQVVARSDVSFPSDIAAGFGLQGLRRVAPNSGHVDHASFAYERRNVFKALGKSWREQDGVYLRLVELDPSPAIRSVSHRIAPRVIPSAVGQFSIPARVEGAAADVRRNTVRMILAATSDSATNRAYAEEAYFFVPMMLSDALRQAGEYVAALDWARTVFDYASPPRKQKIYYGLVQEESLAEVYKRSAEWLSDPLDPHAIAASRRLTYTRFTLLAIVRLLLDYADDEFTADTAETVPRARTLYQTALGVLDLPELRQQLDRCDDVIGTIELALGPDAPPRAAAMLPSLTTELARFGSAAALRTLVPKVKEALTANASWDERLARARSLVEDAAAAAPASPTVARVLASGAEARARAESALLASEVVVQAAAVAGRTASARFRDTVADDAGVAPATLEAGRLDLPWLRRRQLAATPKAIDFAFSPDLRPIAPKDSPSVVGLFRPVGQWTVIDPHIPSPVTPPHPIKPPVFPSLAFCVPPNPMLAAFRTHAELNLLKIRTCRNIAGMKRELDPYVAPIDTVSGLPTIGAGGRLVLPGASVLRPTLYRYAILVQRAKELIATAQQIEASMLSALEKRDAEAYSMMRARQDLELAKAGLALEVLQVKQANDGIALATLQQARAQIQLDHYERLLDEGMIELERGALETLAEAALLQAEAATASFTASLLYAGPALGQIVAGAIVGAAGGPAGAALGALAGAAQAASGIAQALTAYASGASSNAAKRSTRAQVSLTLASFERRRQEWELSSSLARQDVAIGAQQLTLATDSVDIAKQQKAIAEARNSQAKDTVTFLANKFTNVELYDWMSDVLEDVYGFFLQQATSTARLAENQLAFERQEAPAAFIQGDYWQGPDDRALVNPTEDAAVDRRGLTGAARLLQDVHRLDQYAFTTDRRKLQLSKTISLALMAPVEFQRFRETGVMTFSTPMSMFDRDFPGHYLRLIRNVRASVVALVPPTEGIHATLSTPGISRVVIGPDIFQTMPIRRDPELVALTSPMNSSGVFELETQDKGMLGPFEGSGVDTSFELRMPKAANFFDYFTITDVLVTIEYTALQSIDYAQQVIPMLRSSVSGDRPLSFRNQLADPWYDLHNPDQTSDPMVVRFRTTAVDFPPNLKSLRIEHVALYFMRANGASFEVPVSRLRFIEDGRPGAVGGGATSIDGIISTRRGNAGSWTAFVGKTPVGEWELALPDTEETRRRFASAEIEDILFVVTYSGRTHDWPAN